MRTWWFNQFAVPPSAAGGTRHWSLGRAMNRAGHDVTLVASTLNYMQRSAHTADAAAGIRWEEGVRFCYVPAWRPGDGSVARIVEMLSFGARARSAGLRLAMAAGGGPDVVIGSTPSPIAAWAALVVSRRLRVPFFLEVRDIWPESLVQLGRYAPWHPYVRALAWLQRRLMAAATGVISVLPQAQDYYDRYGQRAEQVCVVPNGVDLSLVPEPGPRSGEGPFRCIYAGSHGVANSLETVLGAAARLRAGGHDDVVFELIGDGPVRAALMAQAQRDGLDNVVFREPVPKAGIYAELARADALLMPLQRAEVFAHGVSPNKLWDYFAAARPVLFAVASANNPVTAVDAGLAIAPENPQALAAAVLHLKALPPEARRAMGARGRDYVAREHDTRVLAGRLSAFLERAV